MTIQECNRIISGAGDCENGGTEFERTIKSTTGLISTSALVNVSLPALMLGDSPELFIRYDVRVGVQHLTTLP